VARVRPYACRGRHPAAASATEGSRCAEDEAIGPRSAAEHVVAIAADPSHGTDRILDFDAAEGDRILLRKIDADISTSADDAFAFIGTAAFSGTAGELRAVATHGGAVQRIEGDVDGDGVAELTIDVVTEATATAGWFIL
jgi:serralysin